MDNPGFTDSVQAIKTVPGNVQIESSSRRHIILALYFLTAAVNSLPFSYVMIGDALVQYYNESYLMVNSLALVFMAAFIFMSLPAIWAYERRDLRYGVLIGTFLTTIGAWLSCATLDRHLFWLALVAQAIIGMGQPFFMNVPPYLASIWFPAEEVSRACAIGSFGGLIGIFAGYIALPLIISGPDIVSYRYQLEVYHYSFAAVSTILLILNIAVFKDEPEKPPSKARADVLKNPVQLDIKISLLLLFKNTNFVKHLISFGLMNGTQNACVSVLNQVVLGIYKEEAKDKLWVLGLLICISGMISCLLVGLFLDKTRKYKETNFGLILLGLIATGIWTGTITLGFHVLYATIFFVGFFMTGYIPVGFELGAELTYPISEVIPITLQTVFGCVVGIVLTFVGTWLLETYSQLETNLMFIGSLLVALIIAGFIKPDLRRLKANQNLKQENP